MELEITIPILALAIFAIAAGLGLCAGWMLRPKTWLHETEYAERHNLMKRLHGTPQPWRHDAMCPLSKTKAYLDYTDGTANTGCVCEATFFDGAPAEPPTPPACVDCVRAIHDGGDAHIPAHLKCGGTFDPVTGEAGEKHCAQARSHDKCGPEGRWFKARKPEGPPLHDDDCPAGAHFDPEHPETHYDNPHDIARIAYNPPRCTCGGAIEARKPDFRVAVQDDLSEITPERNLGGAKGFIVKPTEIARDKIAKGLAGDGPCP